MFGENKSKAQRPVMLKRAFRVERTNREKMRKQKEIARPWHSNEKGEKSLTAERGILGGGVHNQKTVRARYKSHIRIAHNCENSGGGQQRKGEGCLSRRERLSTSLPYDPSTSCGVYEGPMWKTRHGSRGREDLGNCGRAKT